MDIKNISDKKELKALLNNLKLYKDIRKKLGKRAIDIYKHTSENKSIYKVEYFPEMKKEIVLDEALKIYKNIFKIDVLKGDIILKEKQSLTGGIRVYKNDDMVDLSFKKIEEKLKN